MFDIGSMELFIVAVVALVVVGPRELPRLLRTIGGIMRQVRSLAGEFRRGLDALAEEVEQEADPFSDLRKAEGLKPGMSPDEITETIMKNRAAEKGVDQAAAPSGADTPPVQPAPKKGVPNFKAKTVEDRGETGQTDAVQQDEKAETPSATPVEAALEKKPVTPDGAAERKGGAGNDAT